MEGELSLDQPTNNLASAVPLAAPEEPQPLVTEQLAELLYEQLRLLAGEFLRAERRGHTLQPTALVHEAYARICEVKQINWRCPAHFFAFAASIIRRVLVDHARARGSLKRGGDFVRVSMPDYAVLGQASVVDMIDLNAALDELSQLSPDQARIVELRFFGGLSAEEAAAEMGIATRTADKYWAAARAWLARRLGASADDAKPL